MLESYSQIISSQLSAGIQCNGDSSATSAMWILPNGMPLTKGTTFMNIRAQSDDSIGQPNVKLWRIDNSNPIGIQGVFWCSVEYSTYTDTIPIIIQDTPSQLDQYHSYYTLCHSYMYIAAPSIVTQSCQFSGFNPMDGSFGVFLSANISNGAPTSVSCSLTHNSQTTSLNGRIYREIHESQSPVLTSIRALVDVSRTSVPSSISCIVSNNEGTGTLTCDIQSNSTSFFMYMHLYVNI